MAADGTIRIIVGAGMDRSVEATFGGIERMAERTGRTVQKALGGGTSSGATANMGRGFRSAALEADRATREIDKTLARQVKAVEKAANDEKKAVQKANDDKLKLLKEVEEAQDKALQRQTRAAEREADKQAAIARRTAKKIDDERERFASRTSQRAVRFLFPNPIGAFGMASRIGSDILHGAGVDFSVAGSVSRAVNVQSLATQLSNQGYRAGEKGPAGTRVEGSVLEAEARKVGKDLSVSPEKLLEAQTKFVDLTGNLQDSRQNMRALSEIAIATHTDFTAMSEAAGNISRELGDTPDKAEKLAGIMRVLAGQGKVGSIEIKDFATNLAKVAALAPKYGGDVGNNITKLTTLAQLSRAEGGSASASQAATAAARFTDVFSTPARENKFNALGIQTYEKNIVNGKQVNSKLLDPFEIIRQSLIKTKGDALKMADLFKSVMAQRAVSALTNSYNQAGGGAAGLAAVNAQFSTFGKESAITKEEVAQDVAKQQETTAAKAQKFQDQLDEVVAKLATSVIPAFEQLAPRVIQMVEVFGKVIDFAAKNPVDAIMAAIALAIGRAALESTFRSAIEKALLGGGGNGVAAVGTGTATGAMGKVGKVMGVASAGITGGAVAYGAGEGINALTGSSDSSLPQDMGVIGGLTAAGAQAAGPLGAAVGAVAGALFSIGDQVKGLYDVTAGFSDWGGGKMSKPLTPEQYDAQHRREPFRADKYNPNQRDPVLNIDHSALAHTVSAGLRSGGPLQVTVTNMPAGGPGGGPAVNPSGRGPDPGVPHHRGT